MHGSASWDLSQRTKWHEADPLHPPFLQQQLVDSRFVSGVAHWSAWKVMTDHLHLTRAAEYETLGIFRDAIAQMCARHHVDPDTLYSLQLAMDEACTNVIEHGYQGMNPGSLMFEMDISPDQVVMRITDFGRPFEPYEPELPSAQTVLESNKLGGFGLIFIYKTMDSVDYQTTEEGNILILSKNLKQNVMTP